MTVETQTKASAKPENTVYGGVIPSAMLSDAAAAAEFYKKAFGAEELNRVPAEDGKRMMHVHLKINGGSFMFNDAFPEHGWALEEPKAFTLHLQVDDVDAWWERAIEAGCTVGMPLQEMFWGDRYGFVVDPYGVRWSMASPAR